MAKAPAANKIGQQLGPKGLRSRDRILAETVNLLKEVPVTDLSMAAIVRRAGITPAAYYLYFDDLGEAVLAALEVPTSELSNLAKHVARPWPSGELYDHALHFVRAYFEVWRRHSAVLRARNVLADSADARFQTNRAEATRSVVKALSEKIQERKPQGRSRDLDIRILAGVLLTAVERSAIVTVLDLHGRSGEAEETSRALAHVIAATLEC